MATWLEHRGILKGLPGRTLLAADRVPGAVLNALGKDLVYSWQEPLRAALSLPQIYKKEKRGSRRLRDFSRATHLGSSEARIGPWATHAHP